jgi:8-oxo-dGTP pyrophosphatase MutT (NUDIX family)
MLQNRTYILRLVSNMTDDERGMLLQGPFEQIWNAFWHTEDEEAIASCFVREFNKSSYLYGQLRKGYWLRSGDPPETKLRFFSLASAMIDTHAAYSEPEWGFPKGRRNINESDIDCAKREFTEETAVDTAGILFLRNVKPVEETFFGMNRVNYRHIYYVASVHDAPSNSNSNPANPVDATGIHSREEDSFATGTWWDGREHEIRRVEWFNEKDVRRRIRHENSTRLHMFDMLHHRISRMLMTPCPADAVPPPPNIMHV